MKLLLDTHIWLWSVGDPKRLTRRVAKALDDRRNELWLSPLSVWELVMLVERGRVTLDQDLSAWVSAAFSRAPLREAPLTYEVALETLAFRLPHRDPVNRLLAATARVWDLTLVTSDERLLAAKGLAVLANR